MRTVLAKLILVVTMAASAFLGGGPVEQEQAATFEGYYLHIDDLGQPSIWAETNGQLGLQTRPTSFHNGAIRVEVPGDSRVIL